MDNNKRNYTSAQTIEAFQTIYDLTGLTFAEIMEMRRRKDSGLPAVPVLTGTPTDKHNANGFRETTITLGYDELVWLGIAFKYAMKYKPDAPPKDFWEYLAYIRSVREHIAQQFHERGDTLTTRLFLGTI